MGGRADAPTPPPAPAAFGRQLWLAVGVPTLALVALALALVLQVRALLEEQEARAGADRRLLAGEQLRQALVDRETGLRGYLLTRDARFLEPYDAAEGRVRDGLAWLRAAPHVDPAAPPLVRELEAGWRAWEGVAARELQLFRTGGDWRALVASGESKGRMDALRRTLDAYVGRVRQVSDAQAARAAERARRVLAVALGLALTLGVLLGVFARRQLVALGRSYARTVADLAQQREKLGVLNQLLEARVEARTRELSEVNRELEAFSYSVSHDLRTPLRAVDGYATALTEDEGPTLSERGREDLARIRAAAGRMGQLIDDLLNLSRVSRQPLHVAPVDVTALVREVAAALSGPLAGTGRAVEWDVQEGMRLSADARLLRVAVENLLGNALKFTAQRPVAHIRVAARAVDGGTLVSVEDDGAGFDMAYASKLFTPFQRLHRERDFPGTGIGLATVARIARRHGGRVEAEGRVGQGARFGLVLPAAPGPADAGARGDV